MTMITLDGTPFEKTDTPLEVKKGALVLLHGDPKKDILGFAKRIKASAVFVNRDYEPYAKKRDKAVRTACNKLDIAFHDYKDQVIFEGNELLTQSGAAYKVFTPYKNKWLMELNASHYQDNRSQLKRIAPMRQNDRQIVGW